MGNLLDQVGQARKLEEAIRHLEESMSRLPKVTNQQREALERLRSEHRSALDGLGKLADGSTEAERKTGRLAQRLSAVSGVIGGITRPFLAASLAIKGFAAAGFAGTAQARVLGMHFQLLTRQIAAIFIPVMEKLIHVVSQVRQWFSSLTSAQQDAIMKWTLIAGAVGLAGMALSKLIPAVVMFGVIGKAVLGTLIAKAVALNVALGGLPVLIGLVVTGIAAVVGMVGDWDEMKESVGELTSALGDLWSAIKGALGSVLEGLATLFAELGKVVLPLVIVGIKGLAVAVQALAAVMSLFNFKDWWEDAKRGFEEGGVAGAVSKWFQGQGHKVKKGIAKVGDAAGVTEGAGDAAEEEEERLFGHRSRFAKKGEGGGRKIGLSPGKFEDVGSTYKRIQENMVAMALAKEKENADQKRHERMMGKEGFRGVIDAIHWQRPAIAK